MFVLLICWAMTDPSVVIPLETNGGRLERMTHDSFQIGKDGSFLAGTRFELWHWEPDGRLRRKLGGEGDEPGKFKSLGVFFWDGTLYWIIDSWNLISQIFDHEGRFLCKKKLWVRQFLSFDDRFFILDYNRFHPENRQFPRVLRETHYRLKDGCLEVEEGGYRFRKITPKQVRFRLDHKLVWAVQEGESFLVVDQLDNKMWIYDKETRDKEDEVDANQPVWPSFIPITLTHYVPPPEELTYETREEFRLWFFSWSRITYFGRAGDDYIVAYEFPDPENKTGSLQAVERVGKDGKTTGQVLVGKGYFVGYREGTVFFFPTDDEAGEKEGRYILKAYPFQTR